MPPITGLMIGAYLVACLVAWGLHELAHYSIHQIHADSVKLGVNRWGPYTHSVYSRDAPTYAIRLGSVAPTVIYGPLVIVGVGVYLSSFPVPQFTPVEWSFVFTPLAILVVPTVADLHACLYAHH